jgi:hypothetical protein
MCPEASGRQVSRLSLEHTLRLLFLYARVALAQRVNFCLARAP